MNEIGGTTRLVGILGWPVEHSLSPRMQNAAFAALGLDWAYVPLPTPPERLEDAVRGLAALGFAGANVTTPHKLAVAALCDTDAPSVNTLVVRDGRVEGWTTDAAILAGLPTESAVIIGDGGAATAFAQALPDAQQSSPDARDLASGRSRRRPSSSTRPPSETTCSSSSSPGQTLVDLPYPETATAVAARAAGRDCRRRASTSSSRKAPRRSSSGRVGRPRSR